MCIVVNPKNMWGFVKAPSSLKCSFFHTLSFFFQFIVFFPSAHFTLWSKNSHERVKGKGKGRERWRKDSGTVSPGPFLMPKVIVFVFVCYRSWILRMFLFFWKWYHQKPMTTYQDLPGTFLAQNLTRSGAFHYNRPNNIGFQESGHRSKKQPSMAMGSWKTKRIE